ncbi:MAG TPA: hypothetical protein VKZ63_01240 [Kofleriaceae bacterium]|nr:hypothetical protein [Kofleriaceae bacterium]
MLMIYLIALIVGGVLLAITLILGGDGEAGEVDAELDADADFDADADGDAHSDHGGFDAFMAWLPLTSLRFWTFFGAFFGLVGTVLAAWKLAGPVPTAIMAVAAGYLSGLMMDRAIRYLRRNDTDSSLGERDVVGATGKLLVAAGPGRTGKVRVHLKGRAVDLLAETDEVLAAGQPILILSMREDGHVVVTRGGKEEEGGV